ncbi:MAG TPA: hypothetical protein VFU07_08805 [Candidatus Lumbricidophila sp.]|nr:hypothetical protein [Candidatus Lumbricidophila sp.]
MQIGTRWPFGTEPPRSVPAALRTEIATVETQRVGVVPGSQFWTLTWLEGAAIAELDDGTRLGGKWPTELADGDDW